MPVLVRLFIAKLSEPRITVFCQRHHHPLLGLGSPGWLLATGSLLSEEAPLSTGRPPDQKGAAEMGSLDPWSVLSDVSALQPPKIDRVVIAPQSSQAQVQAILTL